MSSRTKDRVLLVLLSLSLVLLGWLLLPRFSAREAPRSEPAALTPEHDEAMRAPKKKRSMPRRSGAPPLRAGAACAAPPVERCHQGDVWVFDGCEHSKEKLEECGRYACRDGWCEEEPSEPCGEPEQGRCDGDIVRLCVRGRAQAVDCAAQGLRCVLGDEGAECAPLVPRGERCTREEARCEGNVLVRCEQARIVRADCAALSARCLSKPLFPSAGCVQLKPPALENTACGPCGCATASTGLEQLCDGSDDNGNGLIDEGVACDPVDVIAFIATDAAGRTSHAREDVEAEIALANQLFAGDAEMPGLSFVLRDVIFIADSSLRELDSQTFTHLADDPRLHPPALQFYVPILFADALSAGGGTPKLGVSTLPNGTCGRLQEGYGPDVGLIAVAKARATTTVVHELGHFLGLCHTHEKPTNAPALAVMDPTTGELTVCKRDCFGEGDGVCDTPFDPGPTACLIDAECQSRCSERAEPDAKNLMSYYTPCRQRFSPEQLALMQHTLALRRAWHPCLHGVCACTPFGESGCPSGMSCRVFERSDGTRTAQCALDGPRPVGAVCESRGQCSVGAVCLTEQGKALGRCVRPCQSSNANCQCTQVSAELSVCAQDLALAL